MRYVSATRLVVELARGTWCCKTNTDWSLRTDDFVSERFILTKPGQFLGDSRSEQFIHTAIFLHVHDCVLFNKRGRGDARTQGLFMGEETPNGELLNSVKVSTFTEKR